MWVGLKDEADDYVDRPVNASRTTDFVDLSMLNGQVASDCVGMLDSAVLDLTPRSKFDGLRMRFSDAKSHAKRALAKKIDFGDRISILFDSFDILFGREMSWVPSSKNTVTTLFDLKYLALRHKKQTFNVI